MFTEGLADIFILNKEVVLSFKTKESIKISFLDIDSMYVQANRLQASYILLFIAISIAVILLFIWILGFEWILISPITLIVLGALRLNKFKSYVVKFKLKSGDNIDQPIPLRLKNQAIDVVKILPIKKNKRSSNFKG